MKNKIWLIWLLIFGVVMCVAVYAGALLYFTRPITEFSLSKSGVFGDSFGALTSLFSGLTFAGLIITILQQKVDSSLQWDGLQTQKEDLQLTRSELKDQKIELAKQNETMLLNRFENTFFQIISLHNEIANSIETHSGQQRQNNFITNSGRSALSKIYQTYLSEVTADNIKEKYDKVSENHGDDLLPLTKSICSAVELIKSSPLPNKDFYLKLVRDQISPGEASVIFCRCVVDKNTALKSLIEDNSLLENAPQTLIKLNESLQYFLPKAFNS